MHLAVADAADVSGVASVAFMESPDAGRPQDDARRRIWWRRSRSIGTRRALTGSYSVMAVMQDTLANPVVSTLPVGITLDNTLPSAAASPRSARRRTSAAR